MKKINKLWGSAFSKNPKKSTIKFTAGRDVYPKKPADYKLVPYDLWGNKAHCIMLAQQDLISQKDAKIILKGLLEIEELWKEDDFVLQPSKEDVHTNIESWIIENYGIESGGKLHTARSRNDQSSLDHKLYLRDQILKYLNANISTAKSLLKKAKEYKNFVMPGFTHYQHATPTSFGHMLAGFASMIVRDNKRFVNWFKLHNSNPLGSITAYGTTLPINQETTTKLLGFDKVENNSLDAITNKWEAESDLAFNIAVLMNHLSILAQTLIVFSTQEFNFVKLAEEHSTGSSIMPQKKNPDVLEVTKAKSSYINGILQSLLGIGKDSFIGYNRDSQWVKYLIMDGVEECISAPSILAEVVEKLKVNKKEMEEWSQKGFITSTSLIEQLVANYKIPFRKAKVVVEKAVKYSKDKEKVTYNSLIKALKEEGFSLEIKKKDLIKWQDSSWVLKNLKSQGGPGLQSLKKAEKKILTIIEKQKEFVEGKVEKIKKAQKLLSKEIKKYVK